MKKILIVALALAPLVTACAPRVTYHGQPSIVARLLNHAPSVDVINQCPGTRLLVHQGSEAGMPIAEVTTDSAASIVLEHDSRSRSILVTIQVVNLEGELLTTLRKTFTDSRRMSEDRIWVVTSRSRTTSGQRRVRNVEVTKLRGTRDQPFCE